MSRLPVAPNVLMSASRASGHDPHPDRQTFTDRMLIPMRTASRTKGRDFEPAPVWAAVLVRRLSSLLFESTGYEELCALTKRLLSDEKRGLAALVVIGAIVGGDETGADDWKLRAELNQPLPDDRALGVFKAATLVKRLDALA